jgi:hypothetical protein
LKKARHHRIGRAGLFANLAEPVAAGLAPRAPLDHQRMTSESGLILGARSLIIADGLR